MRVGDQHAGEPAQRLPPFGEHAGVDQHTAGAVDDVKAGVAVLGDLHASSLPAPSGGRTAGQWVTIQAATKPSEFVAQCSSIVVLMPLPNLASAHISTPAATIEMTASKVAIA